MSLNSLKVLLIHGWATNHHIFDSFCSYFPQNICFTPDLLGYGVRENDTADFNITQVVEHLASKIDEPVHVVGWSMGGVVGVKLASLFPERVKSLTMMSSFARYRYDIDYPIGFKNPALLQQLPLFIENFSQTMQRFLELQVLYTPQIQVASLVEGLCKNGVPRALESSLQVALNLDVRQEWQKISVPTLSIFGKKDRITPPTMGEYLMQHHSGNLILLDKSAHAPFISEPQQVIHALNHFWENI